MNVKTFQAGSIAEAVAKVKQELGLGAVILHTRSFKTGGIMGVGARTVVEITAGGNVNVQPRRQAAAAPAPAAPRNNENNDSGGYDSPSNGTSTAVAERHPLRVVYNTKKPAARAPETTSRFQE